MTKEETQKQRETIREILDQTIVELKKVQELDLSVIASEFLSATSELCLQVGGYLGAAEAFAKVQVVLVQGAADLWLSKHQKGSEKA